MSARQGPAPPPDAKFVEFGARSMTAPLRDVLVQRPGRAFGAAFEDPAHGFLHRVDLEVAQREHDLFCEVLAALGVRVHQLGAVDTNHPDLVYPFDPLLVTEQGAIALRSGKPTRRGEETEIAGWLARRGIPTIARIDAPATVDGGDTLWLRPDLLCIGRTLRTTSAGARQLGTLIGGDVRVFDLPYWRGDSDLLHLLSVVSPIADDRAVVFLPLLPVGLWELLGELGYRLIEVPEEEFATLGCNVLAVRPGVCVVADGNPATRRALEAAGCEVHAYPALEIGINGSGGPTCLTRPILRRD
jgi:N-dimethylarginine dimethylaminohydrolase